MIINLLMVLIVLSAVFHFGQVTTCIYVRYHVAFSNLIPFITSQFILTFALIV